MLRIISDFSDEKSASDGASGRMDKSSTELSSFADSPQIFFVLNSTPDGSGIAFQSRQYFCRFFLWNLFGPLPCGGFCPGNAKGVSWEANFSKEKFGIMIACLIVPLMAGCTALSQRPVLVQNFPVKETDMPPIIELRKSVPPSNPVAVLKKPRFGLIAGKTDFRGLLKAPYVRLAIVKRDAPVQRFFFYIGSKGNQSVVPWAEEKVVEPGYFTLQLAPGVYKITHIAIPVGSTIAEEDLELDFEVVAGKVFYVGTLDVEGIKEKVKFGGVPLVRPGFVYRLAVKDEMEETVAALREVLSPGMQLIEKKLFTVVSLNDGELPPTDLLKPGVRK